MEFKYSIKHPAKLISVKLNYGKITIKSSNDYIILLFYKLRGIVCHISTRCQLHLTKMENIK